MTVNSRLKQNHPAHPNGLAQVSGARLRSLCAASGLTHQFDQAQQLFDELIELSSQGQATAEVGDGLSAFEFSVTFGASRELSLVVALRDGEGPGSAPNARRPTRR